MIGNGADRFCFDTSVADDFKSGMEAASSVSTGPGAAGRCDYRRIYRGNQAQIVSAHLLEANFTWADV